LHLTLRQIGYFVAIVDAGTMSRAAERLHVAPTALSLQMRAMEDHFGVKLLDRHSRGIRPNAAGRAFYQRCRAILALVEATEREIGALPSPARVVHFGVPPGYAGGIGVDAVLDVGRRVPGVRLLVFEDWSSNLVDKLVAADLDIALVRGSQPSWPADDLTAIPVLDEDLVFATSVAQEVPGGRVSLAQAFSLGLVMYGPGGVASAEVARAALAAGLSFSVSHQVESLDIMRQIVSRGEAAAITPYASVAEEVRRGEIVAHAISDPAISLRSSLVARNDLMAEAARSGLVAFLTDTVVAHRLDLGPYCRILLDGHAYVPGAAVAAPR